MERIPVLFITYNRLGYSKQALEALMKTSYPFEVFIWDNGSTDGTVEWLAELIDKKVYPDLRAVVLHPQNDGINKAFNEFIKTYKDREFIAKVDNDTIVEPGWLEKLHQVMLLKPELDACGAFMQRPPGQWNFQTWVNSVMRKVPFPASYGDSYLAYNAYTGGTGVLIRTKVFWEEGLLFDKYPCKLGDWTTFQRLLFERKKGNNIAWYSGTVVKLLNIKEDGVSLNEHFPEYEEELKGERERGNAWYSAIGGTHGVDRFIQENGGRERLVA